MSEVETPKVVIRPNLETYQSSRAASGHKTMHNGTPVAIGLEGMTINEVKQVAAALGVEDVNKYDHLNVGQRRMNLGNRIRGRIKTITSDREVALAKLGEDASVKDKREAEKMPTGEAAFEEAIAPIRKDVDARIAEANAAAEEKAAQKAAAKAEKEAKAAAKAAAKAEKAA